MCTLFIAHLLQLSLMWFLNLHLPSLAPLTFVNNTLDKDAKELSAREVFSVNSCVNVLIQYKINIPFISQYHWSSTHVLPFLLAIHSKCLQNCKIQAISKSMSETDVMTTHKVQQSSPKCALGERIVGSSMIWEFLILAQDYKDGSISSDVSGLEAAFPPLNQTFVVSWKGVVETSILHL